MANRRFYDAKRFGGAEEEEMMVKFKIQRDDAKQYFEGIIKPRLDRAYKLYIAYNGDRAKEIKSWQANIFVAYIQSVVETLMPRILDARPDFTVQGRGPEDQMKANRVQNTLDYTWEIANMDPTAEIVARSSLIYGTGFLEVGWKKDVRKYKFLSTKDLAKKKYVWKEKEQVFYDAPFCEWVDNYNLWYDWHNIPRESKQFWFKRLILSGAEIKRRFPYYDEERLAIALEKNSGNLIDYAQIRNTVKLTHDSVIKGADFGQGSSGMGNDIYNNTSDPDLKMHEVFCWTRPFDDAYAVVINEVPILKGAVMPNPYDFKETTFIDIPYLKLPNEFEGMGLPMILENPQIMLNMIKNQRLDAVTLNIHKMWIVNPLANINKADLVTRPFGIIYSPDPNGVREVQFSDVKSSAYKEEDSVKSDMRYASGVDDFSMGAGGPASSATEVRHLRESTLERVRLFVNHLGDSYSKVMRCWISMYRQFLSEPMRIRITGENGKVEFPLIEKDDLIGQFDFKATVIPSIAGKNDVDKKQNMDLFQLLSPMPFIDLQKLTSKVLLPWGWDLESIVAESQPASEGATGLEGMVPQEATSEEELPQIGSGEVPQSVIDQAVAMIGGTPAGGASPFAEASNPINLLQGGGMPPTAPGIPTSTTNPRGMSRGAGAKVNTNIPNNANNSVESNLLNRVQNIQR